MCTEVRLVEEKAFRHTFVSKIHFFVVISADCCDQGTSFHSVSCVVDDSLNIIRLSFFVLNCVLYLNKNRKNNTRGLLVNLKRKFNGAKWYIKVR